MTDSDTPDMSLSRAEAARVVLQPAENQNAASRQHQREDRTAFLVVAGHQLASDTIRVSGLWDDAIEIVFTGLRPGETLYARTCESLSSTARPRFLRIGN